MNGSMIGLSDEAPEVVRRYFEHDAKRDIAASVALFVDDTTVVDEGDTRQCGPIMRLPAACLRGSILAGAKVGWSSCLFAVVIPPDRCSR